MSVLHGGFEGWVARGYPTQPIGPEWQVGFSPAATTPASPEAPQVSNPLDAARDAGL